MINLLNSGANAPDNPLSILFSCHQKIQRFCQQLLALPNYLNTHGLDEMVYRDVQQIIRYFTIAAPLHHLDESQDLFPALLIHCPEYKDLINHLLAEHDECEMLWLKLANQLNHLSATEQNWDNLNNFVQIYRQHMEVEEKLFQAALAKLPENQLQKIEHAMILRRQ